MSANITTDYDRTNLAYLTVELGNTHPTPVSWGSEDPSTGYARVLIDLNTMTIHHMEMIMEGMVASGDPGTGSLLQQNVGGLQPFHFHNLPQGGPTFLVQQLFDVDPVTGEILTATLENTETGFSFTIDDAYDLRPPVNDPARAEFVAASLLSGDAYLGLHTEALPIPATAIAGQVNAFGFGTIDGEIAWLGDEDDTAAGSRDNDLLSLGAGDDFANGKQGDDIIDGGAGDDGILGQQGNDTAWGGDGNDDIRGARGEDVLFGNRGDDHLRGGRDDDTLDGGEGEDRLVGGRGDDLLTGGAEADMFVFSRGSGDDMITDFEVGVDSLVFTGGQAVLTAQMMDLDGDGLADDAYLTLTDGSLSVLDTDIAAEFWV